MAPSLIKLCHQVSGEFGNLSEQSKTKSSLHAQIMKNRLRRCDRVKPLGPPHRVHSSRQQDGAASHLHRAAHHQHIHARERERERDGERASRTARMRLSRSELRKQPDVEEVGRSALAVPAALTGSTSTPKPGHGLAGLRPQKV